MDLKLEFGHALCYCPVFEINGIEANSTDFGEKFDHNPAIADDYGCGDMRFDSKPATNKILKKYKITEEEYQLIASKLEKGLSFGNCGWCI